MLEGWKYTFLYVYITLAVGWCIIAFRLCFLIAANDVVVIKSQGTIWQYVELTAGKLKLLETKFIHNLVLKSPFTYVS